MKSVVDLTTEELLAFGRDAGREAFEEAVRKGVPVVGSQGGKLVSTHSIQNKADRRKARRDQTVAART